MSNPCDCDNAAHETRLVYRVTYVLGRERRTMTVRAEDADTAYDAARFILAGKYLSAAIQGKPVLAGEWADSDI